VGGITDAQGRDHTVAGQWSGSRWAILSTRDFPGKDASLASVSCPSATFCLAVGEEYHASRTWPLVERWNGSTWAIEPAP